MFLLELSFGMRTNLQQQIRFSIQNKFSLYFLCEAYMMCWLARWLYVIYVCFKD
jgi:hypothetical protein